MGKDIFISNETKDSIMVEMRGGEIVENVSVRVPSRYLEPLRERKIKIGPTAAELLIEHVQKTYGVA